MMDPRHEQFRALSEIGFSLIRAHGKAPIEEKWTDYCHKWRPYEEIGFLPDDNAGIACGPASGCLVVDVDDFTLFKALFEEKREKIALTRIHMTGSGNGFHIFYKYPEDGKRYGNKVLKGRMGFDIRGDGGQVIAPGSIHPVTGREYKVFKEVPIVDAPVWILELALGRDPVPPGRSHTSRSLSTSSIYKGIPEGSRDDTLFRYACQLRMRGMSIEEASTLVREAAASCLPPFPVKEALVKVESAWKYPLDFPLTDFGNAERLVFLYGSDFRYCTSSKKWLIWNGKQWLPDTNGQITLFAKDVIRAMPGEAKSMEDLERRKTLLRHALATENEPRLKAMISLAKVQPGVSVSAADLDANPWQLNVQNGLLDLQSGDLQPHGNSALVTKILPVAYERDATCPLWEAFLERIMGGNKELIEFLKRAVGYSLTGTISEQCLFFLYGKGANGKSTFLETIKTLLNNYAKQADFQTFIAGSSTGVRNDIACLAGARLVTAAEVEAGKKMSEVLMKQLTGGDTIQARFLYSELFEFQPTFKIFLAGNHKPAVSGTDDAIWRRIKLIPFTETIPEAERDRNLRKKLEGELTGILRWAVEGCLEWQRRGLGVPVEVKKATEGYRAEMDAITSFIEDCCSISSGAKTGAAALYTHFLAWCAETGEEPISHKVFGQTLKERFKKDRSKKGLFYTGIELKKDE